ncbi:NADH dehydrogenase ubiquinone Fe-S protein 4 [Ketogulonicigenium vulgare]|uniref:NADH-ubiquinone oxidoreductase family protein n=1 Tax=Ketogulonicigenium vulgare (strain WSH-001) TaxID=759362 RepID=F9Y3U9_KETVW|nr:NADH dehydrogenase ubiquinone Fe-S protein 4 [Ketogulonicigenium vulgare]ADO42265.1 ETC complex I subunit conserved region [Ketogulonicigenium vulgare Y25]AEM40463.1 NADH-ubiquinone oxidoreductase family protein [Ketogulonicigenium vulgare WSH-001]ALJ80648.1 ETC complex I subunit [Ketogulonicigenium vulgare]ANW33463.1 ETC complex I subunit [Ketogulonicigenium vulgare]AOZ54179.1 ETC complex I subunit conserved region [Ketogulonicigenium vulgare]
MSARIYRPARTAMSSGTAKTQVWVLEWDASAAPQIDPLMGWIGHGDTQSQMRLQFETLDAALAYAAAHDIDVVTLPTQERAPQLRSLGYGENFATNRREPWSH